MDARGEKVSLSHTLLLLTNCAPANVLPKAIRAVATILEWEAALGTADAAVANVMSRLDLIMTIMGDMSERMLEASLETRTGMDRLYRTCEGLRDELQRAMEGAREEMQRAAEGLPEVSKMPETIKVAAMTVGPIDGQQTQAARTSCVQVLSNCLPLAHPNTFVRTCARGQQVLVDKDLQAGTNQLDGLNECELVTKANKTVTSMGEQSGQAVTTCNTHV